MLRNSLSVAAAVLIGALSFGAALYSGAMQQQRVLLLTSQVQAQIAPIPADALPQGAMVPPQAAPLTPAELGAVSRELWRDPFDEQTFNLFYADAIRTGAAASIGRRRADLLEQLGWRFSPAQQNLIVRDALDERYARVADRADALLRRQKYQALSYGILLAMEAIPRDRGFVAAKLRADPPWRRDYLTVIAPQSGPPLLSGRVATLDTLLGAGRRMTRGEITPSLAALTAAGRGRDAYRLWLRWVGRAPDDLIFDPRFRDAAAQAGTTDPASPFEWRFSQDASVSVQPTPDGAVIDWDHHGVPTLMSQVVPVESGRGYVLTIAGTGGASVLPATLAPAIVCGTVAVPPDRVEAVTGGGRYVFAALPAGCDMATLSINGAVDSGVGSVGFTITDVALRRAG